MKAFSISPPPQPKHIVVQSASSCSEYFKRVPFFIAYDDSEACKTEKAQHDPQNP